MTGDGEVSPSLYLAKGQEGYTELKPLCAVNQSRLWLLQEILGPESGGYSHPGRKDFGKQVRIAICLIGRGRGVLQLDLG